MRGGEESGGGNLPPAKRLGGVAHSEPIVPVNGKPGDPPRRGPGYLLHSHALPHFPSIPPVQARPSGDGRLVAAQIVVDAHGHGGEERSIQFRTSNLMFRFAFVKAASSTHCAFLTRRCAPPILASRPRPGHPYPPPCLPSSASVSCQGSCAPCSRSPSYRSSSSWSGSWSPNLCASLVSLLLRAKRPANSCPRLPRGPWMPQAECPRDGLGDKVSITSSRALVWCEGGRRGIGRDQEHGQSGVCDGGQRRIRLGRYMLHRQDLNFNPWRCG